MRDSSGGGGGPEWGPVGPVLCKRGEACEGP